MPIEQFDNISDLLVKLKEVRDNKISADVKPARDSFWEYCKQMDGSFFNEKKHKLKELAGILQDVYDGKYYNVLINVTVRSGKSYMLTMFTSWIIGKRPSIPILRVTNVDDLFWQFSKDTKKIIESAKYKSIFPHIEIKRNDSSTDNWSITLAKQVTLFGGGIEGTITGRGAEMLIVDDPVKGIKNGRNDKKMDTIFSTYLGDIVTRLDPNVNAIIIILHTRWNKRDLTGRLEKEEGLASLNGNILDEYGEPYKGKWHKFVYPAMIDGHSFDEAMFPLKKLISTKDTLISSGNEDIWQLVYQQNVEEVDSVEKIFLDQTLPKFNMATFNALIKNYDEDIEIKMIADPADSGTNNLAILFFANISGLRYIVSVIYTDKEMGIKVVDDDIREKIIRWKASRLLHEKDGSGNLFAKFFKEKFTNEGLTITTKGHTTGNINKITRILSAAGEIKTKLVFLEHSEQDAHYKRFYADLTSFNKKYPDKDKLDAPDVCAALVTKDRVGTLIDILLK